MARRIPGISLSTLLVSGYLSLGLYVFLRGWPIIPPYPVLRVAYLALALVSVFGYPAARRWQERRPSVAADWAVLFSSLWIPSVLYLFLGVSLWDLLRLLPAFARWEESLLPRGAWALVLVGLVCLVLLKGIANARRLEIRRLDLLCESPPAPFPGPPRITIAVASDLHIAGPLWAGTLARVSRAIRATEPDLVLLPGDLVDAPAEALERMGVGALFRALRAPLGVFACLGNHEYYCGADGAAAFLEKNGISVLRDRCVEVGGFLRIAGREDRVKAVLGDGRPRLPLRRILEKSDPRLPLLLLDHRPSALGEAIDCGASLLVCGHTHEGQFWPINHIVSRLFPLAYGYERRGKTHIVVTRGAGTWGPPVRVGHCSEIVRITLRFPSGEAEG
ncbi:Calcineurin-like phosphohydrolase [Methylacidimicrobium sp. AP8]|uniref:metallophosphoesterase n=1 Tax=Methylacidimicrobium sp. AP8 TaxID=2730359 RepID=UPI0018C13BDB|nr:metallophosphoesterase [Methylacidimicrobium sp. AP8]CAB4244359.1 Calcineurin-like phosphohydrolase [Methylacidimicrobium sp. AP8]